MLASGFNDLREFNLGSRAWPSRIGSSSNSACSLSITIARPIAILSAGDCIHNLIQPTFGRGLLPYSNIGTTRDRGNTAPDYHR
jgi:hypothetical protein